MLLRSEESVVQVQALGHVVLKVSDLHRSEDFYSSVLRMPIISRNAEPLMTFFSLGTPGVHHDFALLEVGPDTARPEHGAIGLAHVAFKVGTSGDTFDLVRSVLHSSGTPVLYEAERTYSKSVHVLDPDGNEIELYIDTSR